MNLRDIETMQAARRTPEIQGTKLNLFQRPGAIAVVCDAHALQTTGRTAGRALRKLRREIARRSPSQ